MPRVYVTLALAKAMTKADKRLDVGSIPTDSTDG
jgi:hypothetical protein